MTRVVTQITSKTIIHGIEDKARESKNETLVAFVGVTDGKGGWKRVNFGKRNLGMMVEAVLAEPVSSAIEITDIAGGGKKKRR